MRVAQRVLVRGPNWLGDLVMAAPAIRAIRDAWPEAAVDVAVPAGLAPLVPVLDPRAGTLPLDGRAGPRSLRRHAARIREGGYDLALLLTNSFGSALAVWHAGVPERWGYRRDGRGRLLTRAVRVKDATRGSAHHADYYAALVEALGFPRPPLELHALLPAVARDEAAALLREGGWDGTRALLACAPGAAYGTAKQWPPRHVAAVAASWIAGGGIVVLVGTAADRAASAAVMSGLEGQARPAVIDSDRPDVAAGAGRCARPGLARARQRLGSHARRGGPRDAHRVGVRSHARMGHLAPRPPPHPDP